jgi:hypothetical protein
MGDRRGKLKDKRVELISDLRHSGLSFKKLAKIYGVTRQAIHSYFSWHKDEIGERYKPKRKSKPAPPPHRLTRCKVCEQIIKLGREKWSHLIWSFGMIMKEVGLSDNKEFRLHLSALKKARRIPEKFGYLLSDRTAQAYRIYLAQALPVTKIGEMFGLVNFPSLVIQHRKLGLKIPEPLFKWNTESRRRTAKAVHERKKTLKAETSARSQENGTQKGK